MENGDTHLGRKFGSQSQDAENLEKKLVANGVIPSGASTYDLERIHRAGGFSKKDGRRLSMLWKLREHCIPNVVADLSAATIV